jgi:hypothetical protein
MKTRAFYTFGPWGWGGDPMVARSTESSKKCSKESVRHQFLFENIPSELSSIKKKTGSSPNKTAL